MYWQSSTEGIKKKRFIKIDERNHSGATRCLLAGQSSYLLLHSNNFIYKYKLPLFLSKNLNPDVALAHSIPTSIFYF